MADGDGARRRQRIPLVDGNATATATDPSATRSVDEYLAGRAPGAYALVAPAESGLIAFPGRLAHAVLPLAPEALRGPDDVRISLAFNYP